MMNNKLIALRLILGHLIIEDYRNDSKNNLTTILKIVTERR